MRLAHNKGQRAGEVRPCPTCGTPFYLYPSQIQAGRRFCSNACRGPLQTAINRLRFPRNGGNRRCEVCGAAFYLQPSAITSRAGRFCSHKCEATTNRITQRGRSFSEETRAKMSRAAKGKPKPWRQSPPLLKICLHCGNEFDAQTGRWPADTRKFCGGDCTYGYRRAHPEAVPNFRGGHEPYYGPNWPQQRRLARARDRDTCRLCGVQRTRPALHVHHIKERRAFAKDFDAANTLENLLTLCAACHKRVEHAAWRGEAWALRPASEWPPNR